MFNLIAMSWRRVYLFNPNRLGYRLIASAAMKTKKVAKEPAAAPQFLESLPPKPKKPASSYGLFLSERYPKLQKLNPTLKMKEIGPKLGEEWKQMPPQKKRDFEEVANIRMKEYQAQIKDYNKVMKQKVTLEEMVKIFNNKGYKLKAKQSDAKPRQMSGYNAFLKEQTSGGGKPDLAAVAKKWAAFSEAEKEVYNRRAKEASS